MSSSSTWPAPAGQGGTDMLEKLHEVSDEDDPQQSRQYEYELVVWAAEQVKSEFRETSWKAFWATTVEHQSVADVAEELGVSPGSIYMSRSRIMARIREKVRRIMDT